MVRILSAIYDQDFIEDSYGFRPVRNCHKALIALSDTVENKPVNHIVEADIKGFFDKSLRISGLKITIYPVISECYFASFCKTPPTSTT